MRPPSTKHRTLTTVFVAVFALGVFTGCDQDVEQEEETVFHQIIGSKGHTAGKFNRPRGICFDPVERELYVVDWDGRLQVFGEDGSFRGSWIMPEVAKGKPEDLWFTPERTILVTDTHYSRIIEFSLDGEILNQFGSYGEGEGQFIYPVGVTMDKAGNIYVSEYGENDRIQVFTRQGEFIRQWGNFGSGESEFQRPSGIHIGDDGLLYVADGVNHRIQVFTLTGDLVRIIGEQGREPGNFTYPYDVVIHRNSMYVLEYGNQRIQRLTLEGEPLDVVGGGGRGHGGHGDGQFAAPWRFTAVEDRVYISDTNNNRVVMFPF